MGDPKRQRAKYARPLKPWDRVRLESERVLVNEYGLQNKREIYRMESLLRKYAGQAKKLMTASSAQAQLEKKALISTLSSLALVNQDAQLDDVLALSLRNLLERRLQTLLVRKGLANTMKQARQMIVHQHIKIGEKAFTFPSYLVPKEDEDKISFIPNSPFASSDHPERPENIQKMKKVASMPEKEAEVKEEKAQQVEAKPAHHSPKKEESNAEAK
jgi:small subunit ribosomal protein S4